MAIMKHTDGSTSVKRLDYGAMVLEGYYGGIDDTQAVDVLRPAVERGGTRHGTGRDVGLIVCGQLETNVQLIGGQLGKLGPF